MCLFDTGKKLQNKEDLKEMGDIQWGKLSRGNCYFQKHMCFLSNGCFWGATHSSFGEMHELRVFLVSMCILMYLCVNVSIK